MLNIAIKAILVEADHVDDAKSTPLTPGVQQVEQVLPVHRSPFYNRNGTGYPAETDTRQDCRQHRDDQRTTPIDKGQELARARLRPAHFGGIRLDDGRYAGSRSSSEPGNGRLDTAGYGSLDALRPK